MSDLDRPPVSRGLLIALGAIVVLAVLWLLVLGPAMTGEDDTGDIVVPPVVRTPEPPVPGEETPGDGGELYPETTEVFAARDPFAQLVSNSSGSTAAPGGGTATPPGGTTAPGSSGGPSGGDGGSSGGSGGEPTAPPRSGSSADVGGTRVKLVDVYDDDGEERALVTVNGRSYDVAEGEAFGDRFRLLDLSGECGTFLFGDSRFVLCEGDEIRK